MDTFVHILSSKLKPMSIQIIIKGNRRLYPAVVCEEEGLENIDSIEEINKALECKKKVFVVSKQYNQNGEPKEEFYGLLKQEDILSIINVDENINLTNIMTLSEAAKKWGLADGSTIRKAIERDKFKASEIKHAGSVWIITYEAMERVFGKVRNIEKVIDAKEFRRLLTINYLRDSYKENVIKTTEALSTRNESSMKMKEILKGKIEEVYDLTSKEFIKTLFEINDKLKNGEKIVFVNSIKKQRVVNIINSVEEFMEYLQMLYEQNLLSERTYKLLYNENKTII